MNTSDKFYLKQGKLELSMLEDEEDEDQIVESSDKQNLFDHLEFEHTKRRRDKQKPLSQPKLRVSKDVYNTLHMMGQFLTRQDDAYSDGETRKSIVSAKDQRLQKIANSIKVQEVELPPAPSREKLMKKISISKQDQITDTQQEINLNALNQTINSKSTSSANDASDNWREQDNEVEDTYTSEAQVRSIENTQLQESVLENTQSQENIEKKTYEEVGQNSEEYRPLMQPKILEEYSAEKVDGVKQEPLEEVASDEMNQPELEVYRPVLEEENIIPLDDDSRTLDQNSIDYIVDSFFEESQSPKYAYSKELKRHIEKQISAIRNYQ